jgi:hypothetical protein
VTTTYWYRPAGGAGDLVTVTVPWPDDDGVQPPAVLTFRDPPTGSDREYRYSHTQLSLL